MEPLRKYFVLIFGIFLKVAAFSLITPTKNLRLHKKVKNFEKLCIK